MALSYCPSLEPFNNQQDYFTQTQLSATEDELIYFNDTFNYFSSDDFINPIFELDESLLYLTQGTYPKRQKTYPGDYPSFFEAPPIPAELPEFEAPAAGFCQGKKGGGIFSAQSIAARERRRKITDKTKELGKLVPGGTKMNTAQMLSSAFDYVKFLQAQLQILQLMHRFQNPNQFCSDEMGTLVGSPKVQEKLYSEGKCLVPAELLHSAASDDEIQLKDPGMIDQIRLLLETN